MSIKKICYLKAWPSSSRGDFPLPARFPMTFKSRSNIKPAESVALPCAYPTPRVCPCLPNILHQEVSQNPNGVICKTSITGKPKHQWATDFFPQNTLGKSSTVYVCVSSLSCTYRWIYITLSRPRVQETCSHLRRPLNPSAHKPNKQAKKIRGGGGGFEEGRVYFLAAM